MVNPSRLGHVKGWWARGGGVYQTEVIIRDAADGPVIRGSSLLPLVGRQSLYSPSLRAP